MPEAERSARDEGFFFSRVEGLMPNIIVSEANGAIIGFVAWNGSLLGQLFIDAEHRGAGVAQLLMSVAECELLSQGSLEAELHCLVGNERARRFYERAGWRVCEVMTEPVRSEANDEGRDFWVMRKWLGQNSRYLPPRRLGRGARTPPWDP
jgi:GNAT superfamily N-acetyltransferase